MKTGGRAALLVACLAAAGLWALSASRTPAPVTTDAPAAVFSAGRAMSDIRAFAARPHPTGSAEAVRVRDAIFARMQAVGLEPRRFEGVAVEAQPWSRTPLVVGARVEDLVGVLPGADRSAPAVLLMAHSDSVPGSPGAADDITGVASVLETVRVLRVKGGLKRDVAVLITDGEEAGLLGARTFFASGDPLLKHIGFVVDLEARGGGGRVAMFETGANNGAAMRVFASAVHNTNANSLMSEVYKYMPNSTDFTVSKKAGYPGFNFAFIGQEFDYHSPSSTPEALDQGSVQHMGDQALAVTGALAWADALPAKSGDAIYSDVMGGPVLGYPVWAGWLVIAAAAALAGVAITRKRSEISLGGALMGGLWALGTAFAVGVLLHFVGIGLQAGDFGPHYRSLLAQYPLVFAGFGLLTAGLFIALTVALSRPERRWSRWTGTFGAVAVLTVALQVLLPPMAVLGAWPLLVAGAVMAASALLEGWVGAVVVAVLAVAGLAHLGHLADQTFSAVGVTTPELLALIGLLALPVVRPLIGEGRGWALGGLAVAVAGGGVLAFVALHDPANPRHPRGEQVFAVQDRNSGRAGLASGSDVLSSWAASALAATGGKPNHTALPTMTGNVWLAGALALQPDVEWTALKSVAPEGAGVAVKVILPARADAREVRLRLRSAQPLTDVRLEGHLAPLLTRANEWSFVRFSAPGSGVTLSFNAPSHGTLEVERAEVADSWPAGWPPLPRLPATSMPWGLSHTTVTTDVQKFDW